MFSSNLSVWPLTPSPWRGRKPETAVTPPPSLPHQYLCPVCLDARAPVLSLNSQINKLPLSCRKIPSDLCSTSAQRRPSRAETGPSWSTTQSPLGLIDSPILRRSNTLVAWLTRFKITCQSRRGSGGGVDVTFQVDVGGTVKAERGLSSLLLQCYSTNERELSRIPR